MTVQNAVRGAVVVGVDGSEHSDRAVIWGAEQADLEGRRLVVVHMDPTDRRPTSRAEALSTLEAGALRAGRRLEIVIDASELAVKRRPGLKVDHLVTGAGPRHALVEASRAARLIVLGSRGRGVVGTALLGSVSASVTRHAECPVVVTRPHRPGKWKAGLLVGADGTAESRPVIDFAFRLASLRDLPMTVMHTYFDPDLPSPSTPGFADSGPAVELRLLLAETVAGFTEKYPDVYVTRRLERGPVDEELRRNLHPWNVIVVGRHPRRSPIDSLGGAVSTAVLERFHGAVAMVPQPAPSVVTAPPAGRSI